MKNIRETFWFYKNKRLNIVFFFIKEWVEQRVNMVFCHKRMGGIIIGAAVIHDE